MRFTQRNTPLTALIKNAAKYRRNTFNLCVALPLAVGTLSLTTVAAPNDLNEQRIPTEQLIEGIKSADGRWFDVEMIIFERTREGEVRETFEQTITNIKPNRHWDLQQAFVNPDIRPLLLNLPRCYQAKDPFNETHKSATPVEFFKAYQEYDKIISSDWRVSDDLCLLPNEDLPAYWSLINRMDSNWFVKNIQSNVSLDKLTTTQTGQNYDDYRSVYLLDNNNLKLRAQADKLNKHWKTKVLLHTAWRQPGLSPHRAIPIYFRAGKNFSSQFNYDGSPKTTSRQFKMALSTLSHELKPQSTDHLTSDINDTNLSPLSAENNLENKTQFAAVDILQADAQSNVQLFLERIENGATINPQTNQLEMIDTQGLPNETWQLDGYVKIILDHYLYFDSNLNYREKSLTQIDLEQYLVEQDLISTDSAINTLTKTEQNVLISAAQKDNTVSEFNEFKDGAVVKNDAALLEVEYLQNFPFKQLRRTYSGDLHYLDHPKFGVLFQIRKYRH